MFLNYYLKECQGRDREMRIIDDFITLISVVDVMYANVFALFTN